MPISTLHPLSATTHGELVARLRQCGLRLTPGRNVMLAALLRASAPMTLAQLQDAITPQRVALATLFRSMLRMEEAELVTRTIDLHGTTNWELNVGRRHAFHLTQRHTGEITPIDEDIAQPLHDLLARIEERLHRRGYSHLQLNVAFRGEKLAFRTAAPTETAKRHVA